MQKPDPKNYLPNDEKDVAGVTFRIPASLKEQFDKALSEKGFSQTKFFEGQMKWLIDLVKFERQNKNK